jgi:hypothetical protein
MHVLACRDVDGALWCLSEGLAFDRKSTDSELLVPVIRDCRSGISTWLNIR